MSRPGPQAQHAAWLLLGILGLIAVLYALPARAAGEVVVDEGGAVADVDAGGGMPRSNPRVASILAAHPGQFVVICVAGCPGKPAAVQILPGPVTARVGGFVPSTAKMGSKSYGPPRPATLPAGSAGANSDVVCVAGCSGRPGQVVQRISGLPPPPKASKQSSDKKSDGLFDFLP